ncbi:DUF7322 domain-containing protein [Halorubrum lipolyticum]|uniref:DUF7322 domain-containing protein n=1 Tax=Halorubrum lipolyticum DSM 21995 TaxID=1227482 RepID=M0NT90_9EURY|nr:hypothetical protein [Halorubrum lipolyticum]EMA61167.1 hypothetical protein C469_07847 [Halorubrum lipolyticum DSM 21995]
MFSLDEDDEGEVSFGESSDAEREMTPDIPKAPSVKTFDDGGDFEGASDVDSGTLRAFVVAVVYANAAVLLVALGPMLWFFEGWSRIGPALFVAGLLAGVRTYQTYRSWERSREAAESDSGDDEGDDGLGDESATGSESPTESDDAPESDTDATPPEA